MFKICLHTCIAMMCFTLKNLTFSTRHKNPVAVLGPQSPRQLVVLGLRCVRGVRGSSLQPSSPSPWTPSLAPVIHCVRSAPCSTQAALKKYQVEHKSKGESLEKCQGELKKLRRKSQGSKNPSKYGEKEMQVRARRWRRFLKKKKCFMHSSELHLIIKIDAREKGLPAWLHGR